MGKAWYEEGIPSKDEIPNSGGTSSGLAWWQRTDDNNEPLPQRFWIPKEETRELSFVDDKCFRIFEHQYWINDGGDKSSPGFVTCIGKRDGRGNVKKGTCPLCDAGNKASHVGFFTVVDHTGYTDRDGNEIKDVVKLLPAKYYTLELLRLKFKKHKGVVGKRFSVTRTGAEQAPTVGDDWDFLGEEDVDEYEPIDYTKILRPMSVEFLKDAASMGDWIGKKAKSSKSSEDDSYTDEEDVDYDDDSGAVPF